MTSLENSKQMESNLNAIVQVLVDKRLLWNAMELGEVPKEKLTPAVYATDECVENPFSPNRITFLTKELITPGFKGVWSGLGERHTLERTYFELGIIPNKDDTGLPQFFAGTIWIQEFGDGKHMEYPEVKILAYADSPNVVVAALINAMEAWEVKHQGKETAEEIEVDI